MRAKVNARNNNRGNCKKTNTCDSGGGDDGGGGGGSDLPTAGSVTIPVWVHVIRRDDGSGGASNKQIQDQLDVLNAAYSGATRLDLRYSKNSLSGEITSVELSPVSERS